MNLPLNGQKTVGGLICRNALKKWKTIRNRWRDYDESIYPLLIVQVPDKYDDEDTQFIQAFREMYEEETGKSIAPDEMRHCFSGEKTKWDLEYISPQDIQASPQIQVVFFKSALTTGWDCPRAEMLISLRSAKDKTSIVQLVGRMLRNPKGFQVCVPSEPDLDVAFLYLPFYDQNILDEIEKEYKEGLTGKIRTNTERVELTWNPDLLDKKEEILEFLNGLLSAQKVWKGKNMPSRVKELREALISAPLKKENVDTAKLAQMLTDWLNQLTTEVVNISSTHLLRIKGKAKLDGVELESLRRDNPIIKKEVVDLDPRDEKRCFHKLEEKIPKLRDGVTEDILRDANRILKESTEKNPDGLRFPILILHAKEKLTPIIKEAMEECLPDLSKVVEQIRTELAKSSSKPRREMRALASSLLDIDSTVEYVEWTCPETQTAFLTKDWVEGKKCLHTYEGLVPPGSGPELKYREVLEEDPNVLAYMRNPQKGNGLAIKYKDKDGLDQVTYPDFLVIEKFGSELQLKIAECKGGEERTPEPDKYKGLVAYEKKYRKEGKEVTTVWVEYINDHCFVARPTMTNYEDRLSQPNLLG
jgi:type III restriction enzyme